MLSDNLEKIKEVKESTPYPQNKTESDSNGTSQSKPANEPSDANKNPTEVLPENASNQNSEAESKTASEDVTNANTIRNPETAPKEDSAKKSEKETVTDTDPGRDKFTYCIVYLNYLS